MFENLSVLMSYLNKKDKIGKFNPFNGWMYSQGYEFENNSSYIHTQ